MSEQINKIKSLLSPILIKDAFENKTLTLQQLYTENELDQFVSVKFNSTVDLNKYLRVCYGNSKQKQSNNVDAGKKPCKRFGPGRRMARLPKGKVSGFKTITVNVPSARGGRKAHRVLINQTKNKINKKESLNARKVLLLQFLKNAKIYLIPNEEFFVKTKDLVNKIKDQALKESLKNRESYVIVNRSGQSKIPNALGFVTKLVLNEKHTALHKVKSGVLRNRIIISKQGLIDLLLRVYRYEC